VSASSIQPTEEAVVRRSCLLFALVAMLVAAPAAWAGGGDRRDGHAHRHGHGSRSAIAPTGLAGAPLLTAWWKEPLRKSADDPTNPFNSGGCTKVSRFVVLDYGGECTVKAGTWIFEVGSTVECSNIEPDPFHADTPLQAALCGLRNDRLVTALTLSLDGGATVSLLDGRFGTFMLPGRVVVPKNGIFGGTAGEIMRFGGHGYVAWIRPLPVGVHTVQGHLEGTLEGLPPEGVDFATTVTVTR
jgi:hypothetical protein